MPVFDTLRVMFTRILKGKSPFKPDKIHLHHIFIQLGCSHIMTTLAILSLNLLVVLCWGGVVWLGGSIETQLYVVLTLSLLVTPGLYILLKNSIIHRTRFFKRLRHVGYGLHISRTRWFISIQNLVDKI